VKFVPHKLDDGRKGKRTFWGRNHPLQKGKQKQALCWLGKSLIEKGTEKRGRSEKDASPSCQGKGEKKQRGCNVTPQNREDKGGGKGCLLGKKKKVSLLGKLGGRDVTVV